MAFPSTPVNGQLAVINNITYVYNSSINSWRKTASALSNVAITNTLTVGGNLAVTSNTTSTSTTTGALTVGGGIGVAGNVTASNVYTTTGVFWSGNGAAYSSGSGGSDPALAANVGTLYLGNISTQANLGAFQTYANATFGAGSYGNANVAAYLPTYTGNITAANMTVTANTYTDRLYTTTGLFWASNGAVISTGGGGGSGITTGKAIAMSIVFGG